MDRTRIQEELGFLSDLSKVEFAEHIAKIARQEALEEAAKMVNDLPFVNDSVAEKIRALKEKS